MEVTPVEGRRFTSLGLSEQEVVDAYVYVLARYLVLRQEHIDVVREGVPYNVGKCNEFGEAEFVNPNLDVAYVEAWLAVDEKTPVILEVPRVEGRYYTVQVMDEWADVVCNINERTFPTKPYGTFAFCLRGSDPQLPAGATRIDLPSRKAKLMARVERAGDDAGAARLQRAFRIASAGTPAVEPAVRIPMFTNAEPISVEAFTQPMLAKVLDSAPDAMTVGPVMRARAEAIAAFIAKDAANRAAIDRIIKEKALPGLVRFIRSYGDKRGGWIATTGKERGFGEDYWFRTAANYAGIWWNNNREVVYYIGETDASGVPLNGDEVYCLHFSRDDLPQNHVHAYWSLTLLSLPDYRVVPNPLGRSTLNSRSAFQYEPDGSLKLHIAATRPADAPEANWLPSPAGKPFTLNLRLYVPKPEVLSGSYYVPPIERRRERGRAESPSRDGRGASALANASLAGDETMSTPYGVVQLEHGYPTDSSSALLFDAMDAQRAAQAYLWSIPVVGFASWRDEQARAYDAEQFGDFVVFDSLREKRGIVTANLTTPYVINWTNLGDGPVIIDYPPGETAGAVLDFWQRPVADLGLTGPDQGAGGTYIVIGPMEDPAKYQSSAHTVIQSATNNVLIGLRLLNPDPSFAATFKAALKMSRVGREPAPVRFIEGLDREWSATPPRGLAYWECLARVLNQEPVRVVDKVMMALLAPLGIQPGCAFEPDARQARILTEAAALGELMARNLQVNPRYTKPLWEGTSWYECLDFDISQETESKLQLDERAVWFYEAVTSSRGMVYPEPGKGQVYMTTKRDSQGRLLRADKTYRLHVPAAVPVKQFWALTLYSEDTRRPYDNGGTEPRSINLDSRDTRLKKNPDGSIDLYVGPTAPAGLEDNWMRTRGRDGWFVYFRLYAPTEAFFDKRFALPDFQMTDGP